MKARGIWGREVFQDKLINNGTRSLVILHDLRRHLRTEACEGPWFAPPSSCTPPVVILHEVAGSTDS